MGDDPHPEISNPTQVTHFPCLASVGAIEGVPISAHYLTFPDLQALEPSVCRWCGETRDELAGRNGIA